jgi:ABC-type multidrug transport system ATPase subunit
VEEKKKYARSLLKILGLESIANRVIGVNAADGISADQRKRVTIGVEMAADPAILFLDEPTSGLDSFGAERVMTAVRNIAGRGTSVVCTIHQPSATIFGMFTHLLLLKKGGFTTYFGPIGKSEGDYSVLLDYFSAMGHAMKPHQNPAEFILEVTGAGIPKTDDAKPDPAAAEHAEKDVEMGHKDENFYVEAYKHSQFYADTEQKLAAGIFPAVEKVDDEEKSRWRKIKERLTDRYASTYLQQFTQTMKRSFLAYWRSPEEFLQKVTVPFVLGVIIGTYFLQLNDTQQGAFQRGGLLYFSMLVSNLLGIRTPPPSLPPRSFSTVASFFSMALTHHSRLMNMQS